MPDETKPATAGQPAAPETTEAAPAAPQAPAEPPLHAIYEIRDAVKEKLSSVGCEVKGIIVADLHKKEVSRRAEAFAKVMEKVEAAEGELKKIKPKFLGVSLDGKPAGEPVYQPEDAKKHKETSELLSKLHNALNKAVREHDFTKVFELANK